MFVLGNWSQCVLVTSSVCVYVLCYSQTILCLVHWKHSVCDSHCLTLSMIVLIPSIPMLRIILNLLNKHSSCLGSVLISAFIIL